MLTVIYKQPTYLFIQTRESNRRVRRKLRELVVEDKFYEKKELTTLHLRNSKEGIKERLGKSGVPNNLAKTISSYYTLKSGRKTCWCFRLHSFLTRHTHVSGPGRPRRQTLSKDPSSSSTYVVTVIRDSRIVRSEYMRSVVIHDSNEGNMSTLLTPCHSSIKRR